ncbi:MAG: immunity 17 family protein [Bacteroidetes bacterium]|nr:immunity 17 family protein [Bacteroidota bacterium]
MVLNIIFVIVGLFAVVCSIKNYDFFFCNSKAKIFVKLFGRNGARVFYILLGTGLTVFGVLSIL